MDSITMLLLKILDFEELRFFVGGSNPYDR